MFLIKLIFKLYKKSDYSLIINKNINLFKLLNLKNKNYI